MDRVAMFVDAGYLFAQGSIELCGANLTRRHIELDHLAVAAARNRRKVPSDVTPRARHRSQSVAGIQGPNSFPEGTRGSTQ